MNKQSGQTLLTEIAGVREPLELKIPGIWNFKAGRLPKPISECTGIEKYPLKCVCVSVFVCRLYTQLLKLQFEKTDKLKTLV